MRTSGRFGKYGDHKRKAKLRQIRVMRSLVMKSKEQATTAKSEKSANKK